VHVADTLGDVIGIDDPRLGWPLRDAMRKIVEAGAGVVVLLRYSEGPRELVDMIQALDQSAPQVEEGGGDADRELRQYGVGAQILRDLGVTRMRVLSAPVHMHAISGFGLEVVDYIND
ncbi:MAG: bifunctional 3,4-dihydroxy-2-butanone-4-phosphate synthase/GTP cyclohydrolase II, partial [Pseudomonadota bacterium]